MMLFVAWVPFLGPMNWMQSLWYLFLVPLAFGIAMIYKAMRTTHLRTYWPQVGALTLQIVLAIAAMAIALILFVRHVLPLA